MRLITSTISELPILCEFTSSNSETQMDGKVAMQSYYGTPEGVRLTGGDQREDGRTQWLTAWRYLGCTADLPLTEVIENRLLNGPSSASGACWAVN